MGGIFPCWPFSVLNRAPESTLAQSFKLPRTQVQWRVERLRSCTPTTSMSLANHCAYFQVFCTSTSSSWRAPRLNRALTARDYNVPEPQVAAPGVADYSLGPIVKFSLCSRCRVVSCTFACLPLDATRTSSGPPAAPEQTSLITLPGRLLPSVSNQALE